MTDGTSNDVSGIAGDRLRSFIERVERLNEEATALKEDIKEVKSEVKSAGFDVPIFNKVIALRKLEASDRAEQEAILDIYLQALNMA